MKTLVLFLLLLHPLAAAKEKKCGKPDNYATLPVFAREELDAIWKNYVPGASCQKELDLSDEIFSVLDEFGSDLEAEDSTLSNDSGAKGPKSEETTNAPTTEEPTEAPTEPPTEEPTTEELPTTTEEEEEEVPRARDSGRKALRAFKSRPVAPVADNDYYDYHDPPPTQGKVAKSLKQIGSPAFKDYGDIELLRQRKRIRDEHNPARDNFFSTTKNPRDSGERFHSRRNGASAQTFPEYDLTAGSDNGDDFNLHFDTPNAPFLKDVSPGVRKEFINLWSNPDLPSEALRAEKVHLLAVSLLSGRQLEEYNNWATNRRKALKVRGELMAFARGLEARRLRRSRTRRS